MPDAVLMDNDVILKASCYDVVDEVVAILAGGSRAIHVLGVGRFVLERAIAKKKNISDRGRARDRLARLLGSVTAIEPDGDELVLAAEFEQAAQTHGLALDGGESQLLAVLIKRSAALLLTGDKRAIRAIEPLVTASGHGDQVAGRVACLEQVVVALISRHGAEAIRARICGERAVDTSLSICFSCSSVAVNPQSIREGLASYIKHLRCDAPIALFRADELSFVVA